MPQTRDLSSASVALAACNKCALCQDVCPAFAATTLEADGARGRNRLIRMLAAGEIATGDYADLRSHLATCMLCGACTAACPSAVPTEELVTSARSVVAGHLGISGLAGSALRHVLTGPDRLDLATKPLRLYDRSGLRSLLTAHGRRPLPGRLGALEAMLPPLPACSFRNALPAWREVVDHAIDTIGLPRRPAAEARPRPRLAYFAGCLTNAMFAGVAQAVYGVLRLNGYDVVVPDIVCCGAAHEAYGDIGDLRDLARRNIDVLAAAEVELVVTDCATCAHMLFKYAELLSDDAQYSARAVSLAVRVREACQLLDEGGFAMPKPGDAAVTSIPVTYHDPCHLARGMGVRDAPRTIIRSIPGVELRELPEPELCCGGAGSFAVTQPAIASHVLDRKMAAVRATGATTVLTTCPACMLQLGGGLRSGAAGAGVGLAHPCQLLWQAYTGVAVGGQWR